MINMICVYLKWLRYKMTSSVNLIYLLIINKRKQTNKHESHPENSHRRGLHSVLMCVCAIPVS